MKLFGPIFSWPGDHYRGDDQGGKWRNRQGPNRGNAPHGDESSDGVYHRRHPQLGFAPSVKDGCEYVCHRDGDGGDKDSSN